MAAVLAGGTLILGGSAAVVGGSAPASADGAAFTYVANFSSNSVTEYAQGANGNVTPVATIAGPNTGLSGPQGVVLDPSSGTAFVSNHNNDSVTEYAQGASGNATPVATIAGSNTGLAIPNDLALDSSGNLFVVNFDTNSVTEYAKGASGNVAPIATIAGSNTGLNQPESVKLDSADNVFVANFTNSVTEYAKGASGNVAPIATIAGLNTGLSGPQGVSLDPSSGTVFVSNHNSSVTEYAKGANGNVAPIATISGSNTGLDNPAISAVDSSGDLFVPNFSNNSVTEYAKGASGNVAPIATISGANTGISGPVGVTVPRAAPPPSTTHPVASSPQFGVANQTDVFRVADNGAVEVFWVQGSGPWNGPRAISPPGTAPPGAHLAASQQFGIANQTDVFVIANNGGVEVFWVQGAGTWNGPLGIGPTGSAPPGGGLAASQQFGIANQTDVWRVANNGGIEVFWVAGFAGAPWNGPLAISPASTAPAGAALAASQQFGTAKPQSDVFVIANNGAVEVFWVDNAGTWNGPLGIGPTGAAPPGGGLAASRQFGIANQTDVWRVANNGAIDVFWVQDTTPTWSGPRTISPTGTAPAGAALAASQQFGTARPQTDVFVIANNGAVEVFWVDNAGTWNGPLGIGPTGSAPPGEGLAASQQFGIANQTDVWRVANDGTTQVFWVQDTTPTWSGPLTI